MTTEKQTNGLTYAQAGVDIDIDLERNVGTYVEPHLWMHYRLVADGARSAESRAA